MKQTYGVVTMTWMKWQTKQKDQPWVAEGPNTLLKLNVFVTSFPFLEGVGVMSEILSSSTLLTVPWLFACPPVKGRTLQYTLIFPTRYDKSLAIWSHSENKEENCYQYQTLTTWVLPFRSCIWLYNLRFSSRTFWYPEAEEARLCRCLPIKGR